MATKILFDENSAVFYDKNIVQSYKYMLISIDDRIGIIRINAKNVAYQIFYAQNKYNKYSNIRFMDKTISDVFIDSETMKKLCKDEDELLEIMNTDKKVVKILIEIGELLDAIEYEVLQLSDRDLKITNIDNYLCDKYKVDDNKYLSDELGYDLIHLEVDKSGNPYINLIGNLISAEFLRNDDRHVDTLTINGFNFRVQEVCSVFASIEIMVHNIINSYLFRQRLTTKSAK